ncbi:MAG: hypothetical protein ACJAUY_001980 [Cognaticolwellia sp.]|jgi:hypothetical protein
MFSYLAKLYFGIFYEYTVIDSMKFRLNISFIYKITNKLKKLKI